MVNRQIVVRDFKHVPWETFVTGIGHVIRRMRSGSRRITNGDDRLWEISQLITQEQIGVTLSNLVKGVIV